MGKTGSPGTGADRAEPRTMSLALAGLFAAGALTGGITLLLPHPAAFNDQALWSNVALAFLAAAVLAATAGRLPRWSLQVAVGFGTVVVTRAVYYGDDPTAYYSLWYIWVGLYACFFFGSRWGVVHIAIVGVAYGWALTQVSQSLPAAGWVMTMGTLAIGAVLIEVLAGRVAQRAEQSDSRARALAAVSEVGHELARRSSPDDVSKAICTAAVEVAGATNAALFIPAPDGRGLVATATTLPAMQGLVVQFIGAPSGATKAFSSGRRFFARDAVHSTEVNQQLIRRFGVSSVLFEPVLREGTPIGVLVMYWDRVLTELDEHLGSLVELLAVEASVAVERTETLARLERVARTDDLTGLANRRAWHEQLGREVARARRQGTTLAVAILDLDHFKAYNDRHGHLVGDRFLKQTAAAWSELVRDTDILARYGGEEFALALPDTDLVEGQRLLDRLRAATPEDERTSAGVVLWDGVEQEVELIARADAALYEAKRGGRDRVVAA
jgi:diguanylate cyclase (GGDEF)-like protein